MGHKSKTKAGRQRDRGSTTLCEERMGVFCGKKLRKSSGPEIRHTAEAFHFHHVP
jgi:hypothetical protein